MTTAHEVTLYRGLRRLADRPAPGPYTERLEAAINKDTQAVIYRLAAVLGGNPRMKRSAAARLLLQKGAEAYLQEERMLAAAEAAAAEDAQG